MGEEDRLASTPVFVEEVGTVGGGEDRHVALRGVKLCAIRLCTVYMPAAFAPVNRLQLNRAQIILSERRLP